MNKNFDRFKVRAKLSEVDGGGYVYGYALRNYGRLYVEDAITHDRFQVEEENISECIGIIENDIGFVEVFKDDELITPDGTHIYAALLRFAKTEKSGDLDFTELAKREKWHLA